MTLHKFFNRIFVINLARRKDRWLQCVEECERNDMPLYSVERFEACDDPENGNAGCVRSHRKLIRQIAESNWKRVLVLEDDWTVINLDILKAHGFTSKSKVWKTFCTVLDGRGMLNERFAYLAQFLPDKWDVLYIGAGYGEQPLGRVNKHVIRCGGMKTTGSYGITREFAKVWTDKVDAVFAQDLGGAGAIDDIFSSMARDHLYYVFQPRLIFQRASKSDLNGETNSYLFSMTDPTFEV